MFFSILSFCCKYWFNLWCYDMFNETINSMLKDVINALKDISLRHKAVNTFKYQSSILANAQGNNKSFQVIVDDTNLSQLLIAYSPNIFTVTLDVYIIGFVETSGSILDIQDQAYDIAIQLVNKIQMTEEYVGIIDIHDYSVLTLSHWTDDNSAGVKLTIEMRVPIGICDIDEYFDDEPKDVSETDMKIDISGKTTYDNAITLKPIKLPRNPVKEKCRR